MEDGLDKPASGVKPADDEAAAGDLLGDKDWIKMFRDSLKSSADYQQSKLQPAWSRNYRAFNNRHMSGSKYDTFRYRHRSKLFKPKTRMAVRKNDATAASAMFSTADVVSITPERASDRMQSMTARFISAALNYRLDRSTKKTGPNWFMTAIGARQDTQITGFCVSKQYWEFEEQEFDVLVDGPKIDVNGMPVVDPLTGQGETETRLEKDREITRDRIMITLLPPEHAFIDVTADWRDPIQEGGFFIAGYPMRQEDLETEIAKNASRPKQGGGAWRHVDVKAVISARTGEMRRNRSVRQARDDGDDRYESRHADRNSEVIWLYECFYRYDGEDWHYWMLGENILLSDPRPTRDSYPEQKGDRPYVMGFGALESHKTHPMAPVESWQPLQQELNDITNLALDSRKMAISPITKIRRGRNIDFKQVQNRGPDAMVMVEEKDDVTFEKAPGPDGGEQLTLNNLNVDFDELAGVFSTGSVQSNRQLNETVGGMQIMAGTSNALTEFDLRVWVETWVEPCLRQCCRLIQFYESDETVMAVAGENAGLITVPTQEPPQGGPLDEQPQPNEPQEAPVTLEEVMNNLDSTPISVRVNVGIGAVDSKQKLEKFMGGVKMTMEMLPVLDASGLMPNGPEMMTEAWGLLGYRDADRFFKPKPPSSGEPPPEIQKIMLEMKMEMQKAQEEAQARQQELAAKQEEHRLEMERMREEMLQDRQRFAQEMQVNRHNAVMTVLDHQQANEAAARQPTPSAAA